MYAVRRRKQINGKRARTSRGDAHTSLNLQSVSAYTPRIKSDCVTATMYVCAVDRRTPCGVLCGDRKTEPLRTSRGCCMSAGVYLSSLVTLAHATCPDLVLLSPLTCLVLHPTEQFSWPPHYPGSAVHFCTSISTLVAGTVLYTVVVVVYQVPLSPTYSSLSLVS